MNAGAVVFAEEKYSAEYDEGHEYGRSRNDMSEKLVF